MIVKFLPSNQPAGKLADAEIHFEDSDGVLSGLKLAGFAVWERRNGHRAIMFPARSYTVNGERRSFALLRPISNAVAQDRLIRLISDAYSKYAG